VGLVVFLRDFCIATFYDARFLGILLAISLLRIVSRQVCQEFAIIINLAARQFFIPSCHYLRGIIRHDNELWGQAIRIIKVGQTMYKGVEEKARAWCLYRLKLKNIRKWQKSGESIILSIMPVQEWKAFVKGVLDDHLDHSLSDCHVHELRGDASATLRLTVESILVWQLKKSLLAATHRNDNKPLVPVVSAKDFCFQDVMQNPEACSDLVPKVDLGALHVPSSGADWRLYAFANRLAYRAGIPKIDMDMYSLVWSTLIHLVFLLLEPGCIELSERSERKIQLPVESRPWKSTSNECMRNISPKKISLGRCTGCGERMWLHHFVPRLIEDAIVRRGIPLKVYTGSEYWDEEEEGSKEREMRLAESHYEFIDIGDPKYSVSSSGGGDANKSETNQHSFRGSSTTASQVVGAGETERTRSSGHSGTSATGENNTDDDSSSESSTKDEEGSESSLQLDSDFISERGDSDSVESMDTDSEDGNEFGPWCDVCNPL